jgi:hypothetical protein
MDGKKDDEDEETPANSLSTKTPPRMASVDDSVMLPESYQPQEEDVICSWARQNHRHRKFRSLLCWVLVCILLSRYLF